MRAGAYCSTNLMNEDELWPTLCRRDRIRYARRPAQIDEERWHATATASVGSLASLGMSETLANAVTVGPRAVG